MHDLNGFSHQCKCTQVTDEGWNMVVRLFGDWDTEGPDYTGARWLELASAAAFGTAGLMWGERMLDLAERELAREMYLAVESAGEEVGLAASHQVMLGVRGCSLPVCLR